ADEDRQAGCALHQGRAGVGVVEAVAGVVRLRDDRIERRAEQRRVHLVGDLGETAVEHRERDGIERLHRLSYFCPSAIISGVPTRRLISSKPSMRLRYGSVVPLLA